MHHGASIILKIRIHLFIFSLWSHNYLQFVKNSSHIIVCLHHCKGVITKMPALSNGLRKGWNLLDDHGTICPQWYQPSGWCTYNIVNNFLFHKHREAVTRSVIILDLRNDSRSFFPVLYYRGYTSQGPGNLLICQETVFLGVSHFFLSSTAVSTILAVVAMHVW